ncbi:ChaN family lipoprotein [Pseudodesulfovibrio pelocollis]|uniref:ChaN family lipoprotein n=1 Tax=Pseudodesulfovibrio pelocollis TaxID=3051432 RepID=UPI00255B145D|nr:ChaN family lipoprotein [Pseudodesulfovibrio sp. SB368]
MRMRNPGLTAPHLALLLILSMALTGCSPRVAHPPLAVTFLPASGEFVSVDGDRLSFDEVMALTRDTNYILLGENHPNVCDHTVQQRVLAAMAESDTPPVVGFEMVAADKQPVLDDFAAGIVEVDDLEAELEWSERWGYPFALFRGHFEIIRRHSLPVAGLNAPSAVTRKIARQGLDGLTPDEVAWLPAVIVPPADDQMPLLDAVFELHQGRDSRDPELDEATRRERFLLVQSIWDSAMAEAAVALRRKYDWPVLVVAGGGHVEHGWGIARRIRQFDPGARILLLMPWRGGEFEADAADAFFFCPDTYESRMDMTLVATGRGGLLVERVGRGSRAETAGLRPGDLLIEAAGVRLDRLMDLHAAGFKVHKADQPLVFTVQRAGRSFKADVGRLGQPGQGRASKPETDHETDAPPADESGQEPDAASGTQPETPRGR